MSENQNFLLKIIGETGISRISDLVVELKGILDSKLIYTVINDMQEDGLLIADDVKLGGEGAYNFIVFELSPYGKKIFRELTGKEPEVSEKHKIWQEYASIARGYLIKEIVYELRMRGEHVEPVKGIFDLEVLKVREIEGILVFDSTIDKYTLFGLFDRIYEKTNHFYFITINEQLLYGIVKRHFFQWINVRFNGLQNVPKKTTASFASFSSLKNHRKNFWDKITF